MTDNELYKKQLITYANGIALAINVEDVKIQASTAIVKHEKLMIILAEESKELMREALKRANENINLVDSELG